ncbi:hypothetical protein [Rheinheimera mangrovi]|uniref:hypothetical protein n=1 Tax=Rheinheimera mangrovi TaxID=2498451 RepID=UPI000F8E964B|nr:hypothetical protein [Rheinheimera mangrovi]
MSLTRILLGRREFRSTDEVIESIKDFSLFQQKIEDLSLAEALLVFKSDTQQCWLVFTSERMYFVVDDTEKNLLKALWAREKENAVDNDRITLDLKTESISSKTGQVLIGNMNKGFMFTKSLFSTGSVTGKMMTLLNKHFLNETEV